MRVRAPFWPALIALAGAAWFAVSGQWHEAGTWLLFAGVLAGMSVAQLNSYRAGYWRGVREAGAKAKARALTDSQPSPWDDR